nr:hypothetical protein [Tanacetum cinerariifolium]
IRRRRYNLIPAESKFKNLMLDHQDKYMMKAQVHVSKSSAILDEQALPRRKYFYYQVVKHILRGRLLASFQDLEHEGGDTRIARRYENWIHYGEPYDDLDDSDDYMPISEDSEGDNDMDNEDHGEMLNNIKESKGGVSSGESLSTLDKDVETLRLLLDESHQELYTGLFVVPYNLPPWKCMKDPYMFMSMWIPGPNSPGINIDVYLQPLVDELNDLWVGVEAYDSQKKENFTLRTALLWTINDFPTYNMLSGWIGKGNNACPTCMNATSSRYLHH